MIADNHMALGHNNLTPVNAPKETEPSNYFSTWEFNRLSIASHPGTNFPCKSTATIDGERLPFAKQIAPPVIEKSHREFCPTANEYLKQPFI